mgnify:CR=1 FL=1
MAGRRRRHRWTGRLAALLALVALPATAGAIVLATPAAEPDPADELVRALVADGEPSEIIECVLRLAGRDLRIGALEPQATDELVTTCRTARAGLQPDGGWEPPEALADVVQPVGFGDDPRLDRLWLACEQGDGSACDRLFEQAPVNSAYETFGLTCGERFDILDCRELDQPDGDGVEDSGADP